MRRLAAVLVLGSLAALAGGCAVTQRLPGDPQEALRKAASLSDIKGMPPLGWYRWGEEGFVTIPVLGIYHRKDFSLGFFGIIHVGTTKVERRADGRASGVERHDWNLLGLYNTAERQSLEGDHLVRETSRRILWIIPIGTTREEVPALDAGGTRGIPPLWFYGDDFPWHVTAPILLSNHNDESTFGLVGFINLGTRTIERDGDMKLKEVRMEDFNLLGCFNSSERVYIENGSAWRTVTRRLLWFLPV